MFVANDVREVRIKKHLYSTSWSLAIYDKTHLWEYPHIHRWNELSHLLRLDVVDVQKLRQSNTWLQEENFPISNMNWSSTTWKSQKVFFWPNVRFQWLHLLFNQTQHVSCRLSRPISNISGFLLLSLSVSWLWWCEYPDSDHENIVLVIFEKTRLSIKCCLCDWCSYIAGVWLWGDY